MKVHIASKGDWEYDGAEDKMKHVNKWPVLIWQLLHCPTNISLLLFHQEAKSSLRSSFVPCQLMRFSKVGGEPILNG